MTQSIYQEIILDHFQHPHNFGDLENPDLQASAVNTVCGDKVVMTIKIDDGVVTDIKFSGQGCAISVASASLLTDHTKGKTLKELKKMTVSDILKLLEIELTPNRIKCALLPLEALQKAIS